MSSPLLDHVIKLTGLPSGTVESLFHEGWEYVNERGREPYWTKRVKTTDLGATST